MSEKCRDFDAHTQGARTIDGAFGHVRGRVSGEFWFLSVVGLYIQLCIYRCLILFLFVSSFFRFRSLIVPYPPSFSHFLTSLQTISRAEKVGEDYTAEEVMVDVKVEASQVEGLRQQLQDATKGAGRLEERPQKGSGDDTY